MTEIDLAPLINIGWQFLSIVALALAGYIAKKFTDKADAQTKEKLRVLVNGILQSGLQMAQAKVSTANIERVEVQSGIVADALRYAVENGPAALKKLGVDVSTVEGKREIADKLESMLAPAVMVAASSKSDVSVATAATIANPHVPTGPAVITTEPLAPATGTGGASVAQVTADAKPPST